ncbi:MAG: aminotransferase class IV [Cyclobacteriaceae bacterium]
MYRFIETIRLEGGKIENLDYHQRRMNLAHEEFFPTSIKIDLSEFLNSCPMPSIGVHKVRLVYDTEIQSIQISAYQPKIINRLKIVFSETISYSHKFEDRTEIEKLYAQRGDCDEIIIVKDNKITDASFANVVFKRDGKWFTPSSSLLKGTMRQNLITK